MKQNRQGLPPSLLEERRFIELKGSGKNTTPTGWNRPENWKTINEIPENKVFGFVFTGSDYVFIDYDHVFADGCMDPRAQQVYDRIRKIGETYEERSMSGSGLHQVVRLGNHANDFDSINNSISELILWMDPAEYDKLPKIERDKIPKIEMFYRTGGRYIYLTGANDQVFEVARDETAAAMLTELLKIREENHKQYGSGDLPGTDTGNGSPDALKADEDTLQQVREALPYISAADYETWVRVGQALRNIGAPFDMWDEWSQYTDMRSGELYPDYKPEETAKKWGSFHGTNWNTGTIFRYARKNGYMQPGTGAENLQRFHLHDKNGKATGVFDWAIFEYLSRGQDMFICGGTPYIYRNGVFRPDGSGAELKTMIRKLIYPQFIKSTTIDRVYRLFIGAAELQITPEGMNQYPAHWINFKNGFWDPIKHAMVPHDPQYKAVNQVPHVYDPAAAPDGQKVRKWLRGIAAPDDVEMLLQFAGYCMTRDTRQQKFLILRGEGGTGKSTVIRMIEAVVGSENLSNISLSQLTQRFAAFGLMGKLVNSCADLEVSALEDTTTLKKVLGEDRISAEAKGKDAVSFSNYAKLIFSTNELPIVKAEKTNGFYRRLCVLTMDKVPEGQDPDFFSVLHSEMDAFIHMCVDALERLYMIGHIVESRGSKEAVQQLRNDSDTVEAFISEVCARDPAGSEQRTALFRVYSAFCLDAGRTALTKNNFYKSMRIKGFSEKKGKDGIRRFNGISMRKTAVETAVKTAVNGFFPVSGSATPFD